MTKLIPICLLTLLIYSYNSSKSTMSNTGIQIRDSLTNDLNKVFEQGLFNGFSVSIVNESGTLYENGIGYANVATKQKYTQHY